MSGSSIRVAMDDEILGRYQRWGSAHGTLGAWAYGEAMTTNMHEQKRRNYRYTAANITFVHDSTCDRMRHLNSSI
jgi:hypothetical protein